MVFWLIFKKTATAIGSPLKHEFSLIKFQTFSFDDNNEESPDNNNLETRIEISWKSTKVVRNLLFLFYQDIFPRNELEIMIKA